jgi:hypothetical protein
MPNEKKKEIYGKRKKKEIYGDLLFPQSITTNLYKSRLFFHGCSLKL